MTLEEIENAIMEGANDYGVLAPGPNAEVRLMSFQNEVDDERNPHKTR